MENLKEKLKEQNVLKTITELQKEATQFLAKKLVIKGVNIFPKEIEVYYYKEGEFEDSSVHRNELQKNNKNHFYVHRYGLAKMDKFKGGNRAGVDFVVSEKENTYYSYLIRSAVINDGNPVVGPNKVLRAIKEACNISSFTELETNAVELVANEMPDVVLFSERINLGENSGNFRDCELRAVVCDDLFIETKYPAKEKMIIKYLQNKDNQQAQLFAKDKLGYIPSIIRNK